MKILFLLAGLLVLPPSGAGAAGRTAADLPAEDLEKVGAVPPLIPVGGIVSITSWNDVPDEEREDWLPCDGRAVDRVRFPELHAIVGSHVPDYSGAFLQGHADDGGRELGSYEAPVTPEHHHALLGEIKELTISAYGPTSQRTTEIGVPTEDYTTSERLAPDQAETYRPANMGVQYIIRAR